MLKSRLRPKFNLNGLSNLFHANFGLRLFAERIAKSNLWSLDLAIRSVKLLYFLT